MTAEGWIRFTITQRLFQSITLGDHAQQLRRWATLFLPTGTLIMGIAYLVQGINLFSPGSAVPNTGHCKVLDPIVAKRYRNPVPPPVLATATESF